MKHSSWLSLKQLLGYTRKHRRQIRSASFFSFANKIFDIAPEILIGMAIDVVVSQENSFMAAFGIADPWHQIVALGILTLFIWVSESLTEYIFMIRWRGLAQTIQHEMRMDTYNHVQKLDLKFFEDKSTGNLVSIMNDDINQLERFLDGGANQIIQTATAVIGVGSVFFFLSPLIATVSFLPIPLVIFGAFYFQTKATPLYAEVRHAVGDLGARLNNNLSGMATIRAFVAEKIESKSLQRESEIYLEANEKAIRVSSAFIPVIRMAILAGFLTTFLLGAWLVFKGELRVGAYGVLVFLTQRLLWPLTGLATTIDLFERAMASTRRILDLINTPIEIQPGKEDADKLQSGIQFNDLKFSYATGPEILKGINLEIPKGQTVAFVGATGSGKSTLVKLLLRFYEPTSGQISWNDKDISDLKTSTLRARTGLVSQDVFLFHGTVRQNISYAMKEMREEDILRASRLAEAHEFIEKLPEGYDTVIGERGQKLSGGQRQRLSLARAILRNPEVLILDEATSAVDNETEAAIQRSLKEITKNRTTIVIAHRLSTIVNADKIYVLDQGQITESGTHRELLDAKGFYQNLWSVQTGEPTARTL